MPRSRLLDAGPEQVLLFPEVDATDDDGNPVRRPADNPSVTINTRLHPVSSDELRTLGYDLVSTVYSFTTRQFPAGAWALVRARGRDWDVVGEPLRAAGSGASTNVRILIRARAAEAI